MASKVVLSINKNILHITDQYIRSLPSITKLNIHNKVSKIDCFAFYKQSNLKKVYFEKGSKLSIIRTGTFQDCTALEVIKLPEGLITIEDKAFKNCTALKELWLPESIYEVSADAFHGWNADQIIYSPKKLKKPITCKATIIYTNESELVTTEKQKLVRNKDGNNYYLVTVKCGHVKRHKYMPITFPVMAIDKKEAAAIAKKIPRVKRNHIDCVQKVELTDQEGYNKQLKINDNDPYLKVTRKKDQDQIFDEIAHRLIDEPNYIKRKN